MRSRGGQSVDLSAIPSSAIERVEILKDGASAVYGTDAIGGVISFIPRRDFQGVELNANYYATEQGGGNNGRVSPTAGTGDLARTNTTLSSRQTASNRTRSGPRSARAPRLRISRTSASTQPVGTRFRPTSRRRIRTRESATDWGWRNPTIPFRGGATPDSAPRRTPFRQAGSVSTGSTSRRRDRHDPRPENG